MKKKICFIAQFPPPIHGLSKAVDTLFHSKMEEEFIFEKVDITNNKNIIKNLILIAKSKADLFYFTISQTKGGNLRDLLILKLLQIQHKKCLIHLHGGYYRQLVDNDLGIVQQKANYRAISQIDGAIVLGESLRSIFSGMIQNNKIFVVPNCVDDAYLMSEERFGEKLSGCDKRRVKHVLYLSNFIRTKGYPQILEMARIEKEHVEAGEHKKFHFDFAGKFFEDTEKKFFFDYIKQYNLEDFITYHGVVDGKEKCKLLELCDIFVLLTRYPNEGQPISILEAMGNGMVVVTTDHAGIPDIVKDGVNGVVVKKNVKIPDLRALNGYEKIMTENYNHIKKNYTQEKYIKNMEELFKRIS